ncbi:hypothetical protein M8J76_007491 [Diaphorina citri]|nr:hypothetical protein M8J76_007491 [Diaphorina citri]
MTSLAAEVKAKTSHWRLSRTRGFDQKRKARVFLNDPFENETDTISISMQDITPPGFNRRLRHGTDSSQDSGIHKDISTNELATSSSSEDSGTTTETIKEAKSLDNIMGKYYEGKITRIPVTSPPHGSGTLECENDNLVEEVYITKHDCDNRGYESDTSLSNSISSSISSNEIERTLASLESCQVEIHRSENNGQVSTTSTYSKNQIKSSTSSLESATNQIKNSLDAIKLKITQAECNNNDIEVDTKVTSAEDSGRYKQLDPVSGYQNTTIIPIEDLEDAPYKVIIAIDFGTTYTGYAFSFVNNDCDIHIMRKWEGGDCGINNQKSPTILLLTPELEFHSFGYAARDHYHDLEPEDARNWYYFDKFKMALHHNADVNRDLKLSAANGESILALTVFKHSLVYLKYQALRELNDQAEEPVSRDEIRWVITVPAIWSQQAKQFIREAAYSADLCNIHAYDQLLIALEPEAAAIFCRSLRLSQMFTRANESSILVDEPIFKDRDEGCCYMVVDCGGGTVDITVHQLSRKHGSLRELHKASGGACGSIGIDGEFIKLVSNIFGANLVNKFKLEKPSAFIELLLNFESKKRSASNDRKQSSYGIFPPFSFIEFYKNNTGKEIGDAVKEFNREGISWSSQGMLKLSHSVMERLFQTTLDKIHIKEVLNKPRLSSSITHLFLVGGFAESQLLQDEVKRHFSKTLKVIIPQDVSLSVLKGAVMFGLDPHIVSLRKATHTYGIGVFQPFQPGLHSEDKLIISEGKKWCADVLDEFIRIDQCLQIGESIVRRYTPTSTDQDTILINIYSTESEQARYITDSGVQQCGILKLKLSRKENRNYRPREILTRFVFGGTEISASAIDMESGTQVDTNLDFLCDQSSSA